MVAGEGRVHHQHVADELVIGVIIRNVIEDNEGIEEGHGEDQSDFSDAQYHD